MKINFSISEDNYYGYNVHGYISRLLLLLVEPQNVTRFFLLKFFFL